MHGADKIEKQLIKKLLGNYDRRVRPGLNSSTPLNVTFGLSLAQLIDVVRSKRYMCEPSCMQIRIHIQKYWHVKIIFNFVTEKRSYDNSGENLSSSPTKIWSRSHTFALIFLHMVMSDSSFNIQIEGACSNLATVSMGWSYTVVNIPLSHFKTRIQAFKPQHHGDHCIQIQPLEPTQEKSFETSISSIEGPTVLVNNIYFVNTALQKYWWSA